MLEYHLTGVLEDLSSETTLTHVHFSCRSIFQKSLRNYQVSFIVVNFNRGREYGEECN